MDGDKKEKKPAKKTSDTRSSKSNKKKYLLGGLVLLMLVAVGVGAYLLLNQEEAVVDTSAQEIADEFSEISIPARATEEDLAAYASTAAHYYSVAGDIERELEYLLEEFELSKPRASTAIEIADAYEKLGDLEKEELYIYQAINILTSELTEKDGMDLATNYSVLASLYLRLGDSTQANVNYYATLEALEDVQDDDYKQGMVEFINEQIEAL